MSRPFVYCNGKTWSIISFLPLLWLFYILTINRFKRSKSYQWCFRWYLSVREFQHLRISSPDNCGSTLMDKNMSWLNIHKLPATWPFVWLHDTDSLYPETPQRVEWGNEENVMYPSIYLFRKFIYLAWIRIMAKQIINKDKKPLTWTSERCDVIRCLCTREILISQLKLPTTSY